MIPADFLQVTTISVLKAIGKEKMAILIFFIAYYAIGLPLACYLGIIRKLEIPGMVAGFMTGCYLLLVLSVIALCRTNLKKQVDELFQSRTK